MSKVYTEQEMREMANAVDDVSINYNGEYYYEKYNKFNPDLVRDMLRQAADNAEKLARAKRPDACPANPTNKMCYLHGEYCCVLVRYLQKNITQLNSRLESVVKECEKQIPACRGEDCKCNPTDSGYCDENCHDEIIVHKAVTAILRVARGDAVKEEK